MKLSRLILSYLKDPVEIWEQFNQHKLSKENFLQFVSSAIALGAFAQGFAIVHTHLLLSDSQFLSLYLSWRSDHNDPFVIDNVQHFSSVLYWGEVFGALISFPIVDTFGRKQTYLFASLLCALMLLCQMLTSYLPNILSLRFILGVTFGFMAVVAPIYVAEISQSEDRGQHVSLIYAAALVGGTLCLLVYPLFHILWPRVGWSLIYIIPLVAILFSSYVVMFLPDSPRYLLAKKTPTDCSKALKALRQRTSSSASSAGLDRSTAIINRTQNSVNVEFNVMYRGLSNDARLGDSFLELFGYPSIRYRMVLMLLLYFLQCVMFVSVLWLSFLLFHEIVTLNNSILHNLADGEEMAEVIVIGYGRYYLLSICWCVVTITGCYFLFTRIDRVPNQHSELIQQTINTTEPHKASPLTSRTQSSVPSTPIRGESNEIATPSHQSSEASNCQQHMKALLEYVVGRRGLLIYTTLLIAVCWLILMSIAFTADIRSNQKGVGTGLNSSDNQQAFISLSSKMHLFPIDNSSAAINSIKSKSVTKESVATTEFIRRRTSKISKPNNTFVVAGNSTGEISALPVYSPALRPTLSYKEINRKNMLNHTLVKANFTFVPQNNSSVATLQHKNATNYPYSILLPVNYSSVHQNLSEHASPQPINFMTTDLNASRNASVIVQNFTLHDNDNQSKKPKKPNATIPPFNSSFVQRNVSRQSNKTDAFHIPWNASLSEKNNTGHFEYQNLTTSLTNSTSTFLSSNSSNSSFIGQYHDPSIITATAIGNVQYSVWYYLRLLLYCLFCCCILMAYLAGWAFLPSLLVIEYFPYRARAKLYAALTTFYYLCLLLLLDYFYRDNLLDGTLHSVEISPQRYPLFIGCFYCAVLSLFAAFLVWWYLPETTDVMLEDIETMFRGRAMHRSYPINSSSSSLVANSNSNSSQSNMLGQFSTSCSCLLPPWEYYPEVLHPSSAATTTLTHNIITPAKNFKDVVHADGYTAAAAAGNNHEFYEPTSLHKYSREMREMDFFYLHSNASSGNKLFSLMDKKPLSNTHKLPPLYASYGSILSVSSAPASSYNSSLESAGHADNTSDSGNSNGISYRSSAGFYQADTFPFNREDRKDSCEDFHEKGSDKITASSFDASWPFQQETKKKINGSSNSVRKIS